MLRQVKPNGEYKTPDAVTYLEMARIAMATVPDTIVEEMDMSDDELIRLREQLQQHLDN